MESQDLEYELDFFYSYGNKLRSLDDLNSECFRNKILADKRFLVINRKHQPQQYFISKNCLYFYLFSLNFLLAKLKRFGMSKKSFWKYLNPIMPPDWPFEVPLKLINFGNKYGLVCHCLQKESFNFPYAKVFSFLNENISCIIKKFLKYKDYITLVRPEKLEKICTLIEAGINNFKPNTQNVIRKRYGLGCKEMKLRQIGEVLKFSPEGIRRIIVKFKQLIFSKNEEYISPFITAFLCYLIRMRGSLIESSKTTSLNYILLLVKLFEVPYLKNEDLETVLFAHPEDLIKPILCKERKLNLDLDTITSNLSSLYNLNVGLNDLINLSKKIYKFRRGKISSVQRVYLTLKSIGKPAHFSLITECHNQMFEDFISTKNSIHNYLSNAKKLGVVWVGIRGTFALEEWGYKQADVGLYDLTYSIVEAKYKETGLPVPLDVIISEIGKIRIIANPNSVKMSISFNPKLTDMPGNKFIPLEESKEQDRIYNENELDEILQDFITDGRAGHIRDNE